MKYNFLDRYMFPAPLEVDRYLYTIILLNKLKTFCFRPLARQIGIYTEEIPHRIEENLKFPSPLEVDRYLYRFGKNDLFFWIAFPAPRELDRWLYINNVQIFRNLTSFPSPLEVDRYLYMVLTRQMIAKSLFPSPLEVDRQIYKFFVFLATHGDDCFRPLARQIGSYTECYRVVRCDCLDGFRPLARYIGIYTKQMNDTWKGE